MDSALIGFTGVVIGGLLGAWLGHRRWLQQARLEQYAGFLRAAHDSMDEYVAHVGHGTIPVDALRAANRQLQLVRLVAPPDVDQHAMKLFDLRGQMHDQEMGAKEAYQKHLDLIAEFMSAARADLLTQFRPPARLRALARWARRRT